MKRRVWASAGALLLRLILPGGAPAAEKPFVPSMELLFRSEIRDELALYSIDRAVRKIKGVTKTEGSWREKRIRVEIDPAAPLPVAEVNRTVQAAGHELKQMVVECRGAFYREGFRKIFRSEPGDVMFKIAEGRKSAEMGALKLPARVQIRGRVDLERMASPFALVVLWYAPYD